jgi:hypothetical protein
MNPVASLLFYLAHAAAPKADKLWIGDMRLEAHFVPNQLRFALSALGLAFRFRLAALKLNRPVGIAFGSVALAALATVLVVPRLFTGGETTNAAMTQTANASYESVEDLAQERGYSAAAQDAAEVGEAVADEAVAMSQPQSVQMEPAPQPASPAVAETEIQTGSPAELELSDSESPVEVPLDVPATAEAPLEQEPLAQASEPQVPSQEVAIPAPTATITASTGAASEESDESSTTSSETAKPAPPIVAKLPEPATPSVDTEVISTQVKNESVTIQVTGDALLTLYRDTNFSGSPRAHRYVIPGESFIANAPFSLYTNNAGAITVTVDGESYSLGETDEEQFRIFSEP